MVSCVDAALCMLSLDLHVHALTYILLSNCKYNVHAVHWVNLLCTMCKRGANSPIVSSSTEHFPVQSLVAHPGQYQVLIAVLVG